LPPGAIEGCARLRVAGYTLAIASITWRFAVDHFADLVGAEYRLGTSVLADGQWDHVWPETKGEWVVELTAKLGLDPDAVAAVGDGRLDVPMLQIVGVPVFVGATAIAGLPEHTLVLHDADLRAVADYILTPAVDR
jgi:phosphoserine phosphatase